MIKAPTSSTTFFTLWDMDDTSVSTADKTIKNAHLLLPIKLFQTRAPNQHFGILTNRAPIDEIDNDAVYAVSQYVKDLNSFGISIPEDHLIFGGAGSDNAKKLNQDWLSLEQALQVIEAQIQSLKLTDAGAELARLLPKDNRAKEPNGALARLIEAKYHGKNYLITDFLNKHYFAAAQEYRFQTGICKIVELTVVMVDDLATIAEKTKALGKGFIGIKASDGGKPPKGQSEVKAFHQDDYLFELAQTIGLSAYANSVIEDPKKHANDDALLQFSALLYAWHVLPHKIQLSHFMRLEKCLVATECDQIATMLAYIQAHPNTHMHAHYRTVDELAQLLQSWADNGFLNDVADKLQFIRAKTAAIASPLSSTSETDLLAEPKKKGLGSLIKTLSARSSSNLQKRDQESAAKQQQDEQLAKLLQKEQVLKARLVSLFSSNNADIAQRAQKIKESIEIEGAYHFSTVYRSSSTSTSASSSGSASASTSHSPAPLDDEDELIHNRRSSYTPRSSAAAASSRLLYVANAPSSSTTVESLDIQMPDKPTKPKKSAAAAAAAAAAAKK